MSKGHIHVSHCGNRQYIDLAVRPPLGKFLCIHSPCCGASNAILNSDTSRALIVRSIHSSGCTRHTVISMVSCPRCPSSRLLLDHHRAHRDNANFCWLSDKAIPVSWRNISIALIDPLPREQAGWCPIHPRSLRMSEDAFSRMVWRRLPTCLFMLLVENLVFFAPFAALLRALCG